MKSEKEVGDINSFVYQSQASPCKTNWTATSPGRVLHILGYTRHKLGLMVCLPHLRTALAHGDGAPDVMSVSHGSVACVVVRSRRNRNPRWMDQHHDPLPTRVGKNGNSLLTISYCTLKVIRNTNWPAFHG